MSRYSRQQQPKATTLPGADDLPLVWKGLVDIGSGAIPAATKGFVDGAAKENQGRKKGSVYNALSKSYSGVFPTIALYFEFTECCQ